MSALALPAFMLSLNALVPWHPHVEGYSEKLEFYRRHKGDYSVVFAGSSRILAHVDPLSVDEAAAAGGVRTRSFNFGVDALQLIEMGRLIEEILEADSPSLRYLFIEPAFGTAVPLKNLVTERNVYFHDLDSTLTEISCSWTAYPDRRFEAVARSAQSALYHYANLGRLTSLAFPRHGLRAPPALDIDLIATGGFRPQNLSPDPEVLREHDRMRADLDFFVARMALPRRLPEDLAGRWEPHARFYLEMADRIKAAGVQPVFLMTPGFHNINGVLEFIEIHRRTGSAVPLLSYVNGHEDLYRPELWFDPGHMMDTGARLFSRRLGQDVAQLMARQGDASCCSSS